MKPKQALWLIIVLAALAALAAGLYSMSNTRDELKVFTPALPGGVALALEGKSRITSSVEGVIEWSMLNKGLVFHQSKDMVEVAAPEAWVPLKDGGTVYVSGLKGWYFSGSENIHLEDEAGIYYDNQGRREWTLFGDTASYIKDEDAFYISGIDGVLYPASGDTVRISAENGRYDSRTRAMKVRNNVRCVYSKGITLETNELDYEIGTNVASTDDEVTITGGSFKLRGKGLVADLKNNKTVVKKSVRLRFQKGMGGVK